MNTLKRWVIVKKYELNTGITREKIVAGEPLQLVKPTKLYVQMRKEDDVLVCSYVSDIHVGTFFESEAQAETVLDGLKDAGYFQVERVYVKLAVPQDSIF